MAWQEDYSRKRSKEAASHLRSWRNTEALNDQLQITRPYKRGVRSKRFGLELTYKSFILGGSYTYKQWYATEAAREKAFVHYMNETLCGKLRYSKVERCYR